MSTTKSDKSCEICPVNSQCATTSLSSETACPTKKYAPPGSSACMDCPNNGNSPCEIDKIGVTLDCEMGTTYDPATDKCTACASGFECKANTKVVCPKGTVYDPAYARCVECDETHICVYNAAGANQAPNRWCYGKDPSMTITLNLFINANRLSAYHYQHCIDCNHPDNLD